MADDASASSSDSSVDDFLTSSSANLGDGETDREAMVRKKLLESFYGKTAVSASLLASEAASNTPSQQQRTSSGRHRHQSARHPAGAVDDLDSEAFDATKYAEQHIATSSTHELLETEERLALSVRTLDSTMQTLVYENYSRFIDATDAIRSIGVHVNANQEGLSTLVERMHQVDLTSRHVEEELGTLRDAVAEKIRVQRLLQRLDALLKLPVTLRHQMEQGEYRTATRSYLAAASILAKHSGGFESLRSIESECNAILEELKGDLEHKMLHWSGRAMTGGHGRDGGGAHNDLHASSYDDSDDGNAVGMDASYMSSYDDDDQADAPEPPKHMDEIFEVSGTLYILLQENEKDPSELANKAEDIFSMAVAAAMRLLDRLLDSHLISVQERRFAAISDMGQDILMLEATAQQRRSLNDMKTEDGSSLVPRQVLDAILQGATLYGIAFGPSSAENDDESIKGVPQNQSNEYLIELVSEGYSSFLSHVRSVLLEESIQASKEDSGGAGTETEASAGAGESNDPDAQHEELSAALTLLVQCVQDLAAGLALPEVGIQADFAQQLVDQSLELAEWMIRRRVDQKFFDLRLAVAKDCLVPFATNAVKERDACLLENKVVLPQIVQIASSSLSDCLQLVDDAIRSIFSDPCATSASENGSDLDLKDAVHASALRFIAWLANSFEVLAGGVPSTLVAEAPLIGPAETESPDEENKDEMNNMDTAANGGNMSEPLDDSSNSEVVELLDSCRDMLVSDDGFSLHSDFILAIVELCRLSEISVPENLNQSFAAHLGEGGKKKSRGIFPSGTGDASATMSGEESEICNHFKLAASRVLVLYAADCGTKAANAICKTLVEQSMMLSGEDDTGSSKAPSESAREVLAIGKKACMECATLFGGAKRSGPFPKWEDDILPGFSSAMLGRKTGLQLDVERMFKEKVTIYPHPSQILNASRETVLFLFFKIVFRAMFETARRQVFSAGGYQHLLVDIAFLKHALPHYVSSEFVDNGTNAVSALIMLLDDVTETIEDRCTDESCVQDASVKQEAKDIVKSFVDTLEADHPDVVEQIVLDDSKCSDTNSVDST